MTRSPCHLLRQKTKNNTPGVIRTRDLRIRNHGEGSENPVEDAVSKSEGVPQGSTRQESDFSHRGLAEVVQGYQDSHFGDDSRWQRQVTAVFIDAEHSAKVASAAVRQRQFASRFGGLVRWWDGTESVPTTAGVKPA
jgi:hypothetical protein